MNKTRQQILTQTSGFTLAFSLTGLVASMLGISILAGVFTIIMVLWVIGGILYIGNGDKK